MRPFSFAAVMAALAFSALLSSSAPGQGDEKVVIAMPPSLLQDQSEAQQKFITDEFPTLVKDVTGLVGVMQKTTSVKEASDKLAAGEVQFAVFQGIEFAEALVDHPEFQAAMIATYRKPQNKAIVVAKKDAATASIADLKGAPVAVLKQGKEHIRRYLRKETGGDPATFFGKAVEMTSSESALDAVLLNKVQAAAVDEATLENYKEVNPGRFNKLKIIGESAYFPPSAVVYNPKKTAEATVKRFQSGMLKAADNAKSREVMNTFRITSFEPVPSGFAESLVAIRKAYP